MGAAAGRRAAGRGDRRAPRVGHVGGHHQGVPSGAPDLDGQLAAAPVDLRDGLLAPAPQDPDARLRLPHLHVDGLAVDVDAILVDDDDAFFAVDANRQPALDRQANVDWTHDSMNDLSRFERDGWRSLRSAFASIWRIRSRVTSKS